MMNKNKKKVKLKNHNKTKLKDRNLRNNKAMLQ